VSESEDPALAADLEVFVVKNRPCSARALLRAFHPTPGARHFVSRHKNLEDEQGHFYQSDLRLLSFFHIKHLVKMTEVLMDQPAIAG
jgi:hypothetical protein